MKPFHSTAAAVYSQVSEDAEREAIIRRVEQVWGRLAYRHGRVWTEWLLDFSVEHCDELADLETSDLARVVREATPPEVMAAAHAYHAAHPERWSRGGAA